MRKLCRTNPCRYVCMGHLILMKPFISIIGCNEPAFHYKSFQNRVADSSRSPTHSQYVLDVELIKGGTAVGVLCTFVGMGSSQ